MHIEGQHYNMTDLIIVSVTSLSLSSYFPWLCAQGGWTMISCHFNIYSGKTGLCFNYYCAVLWWVQIIGYIMAWRSNLFAHHAHFTHFIIWLSSLCRLIWMHWTYKIQVYFVECIYKIISILSSIFHAKYGSVWSLLIALLMNVLNTCTLSYYHFQIGSMIQWPLFRVWSWNCMTWYVLMIVIFYPRLQPIHSRLLKIHSC